MSQAHSFDTTTMAWVDHPTLPGLKIKGMEGRDTHPRLSFMLVRVVEGGVIPRHAHDVATETAYVVSGHGQLFLGVDESGQASEVLPMEPGGGASVPPGLYHAVKNTGDGPLEILAIHSPPTR